MGEIHILYKKARHGGFRLRTAPDLHHVWLHFPTTPVDTKISCLTATYFGSIVRLNYRILMLTFSTIHKIVYKFSPQLKATLIVNAILKANFFLQYSGVLTSAILVLFF